jgi:hypothetical protein
MCRLSTNSWCSTKRPVEACIGIVLPLPSTSDNNDEDDDGDDKKDEKIQNKYRKLTNTNTFQ